MELAGNDYVPFVYLNGYRLYTERGWKLYVYSMSDLSSPIATYPASGGSSSCIITDNHLYLGGGYGKLHIFEINTSISQPLKPVKVIDTADDVNKILIVGKELLLGQRWGYF